MEFCLRNKIQFRHNVLKMYLESGIILSQKFCNVTWNLYSNTCQHARIDHVPYKSHQEEFIRCKGAKKGGKIQKAETLKSRLKIVEKEMWPVGCL